MPVLLLIDQDPLTSTVLHAELAALGWTVRLESDGAAAVRSVRAEPPDAVMLDLALHGLDGIAVCAQLRLLAGSGGMPILVTAVGAEAREDAAAAGADVVLDKPAAAEAAHTALSELLTARGRSGAPMLRRVGTASESGVVRAGWMSDMVRRLWREHYTGVLDVQAPELNVRVYFQHGHATAARSSSHATDFGQVLGSLGLADRARVDAVAAEPAERRGVARTLGEKLVDSGLVDRAGVERGLREQVLRRILEAAHVPSGTWRLTAAATLGFAGFEVPPVAIEWRLGGVSDVLPGTGFRAARVTAPALGSEAWDLLDPRGSLAPLRARIQAGARMADLLAEGPHAERLLGLMYAYNLLKLTVDSLVPAGADERADTTTESIVAEHRLLADATHYAALDVPPGAPADEVRAAAERAVAELDTLAAGPIDGPTRQRLRELRHRVLEAARVLADPELRAAYDAQLRAPRASAEVRGPAAGESPEDLAARGRVLLDAGQPVAAACFLAAARNAADTPDAETLALLGAARGLACPEDAQAGLDALRAAVSLDPECELALLHLGLRLAARPDGIAEARRCFRSALEVNPNYAAARAALQRLAP